MEVLAQTLITGILVGSIYALVALGWAIIYKCSGVLNIAMGELTLIGAYVCLSFYIWGIPFPLALTATIIIGLILGMVTERLFLRPMIGEPILPIIMITVGLSFFFRGLVCFIWGTDTRVFEPAIFPIEPVKIGEIVISQVFFWSFVVAIILVVILTAFFRYTRIGLAMQATADDEMAALSVGVSAKTVYAFAWALAFAAAGVGGTLLGNINGLNIAVGYLGLLVLPAVVIGGLNSLPGAVVGGIIIGVLQNIAGTYLDALVPGGLKDIFPFMVMTVVLLFKPYGIWGWVRIERM